MAISVFPIENNDIGPKTQLSECLCSGVDQPFFCFCVFVLINLMCFSTTCVSVSTLILVFWCLHVGQTFKSIICVSVFTFQIRTCFSVYLLVSLRRAVFSLLIIINWHQEVDAAEGCWGEKLGR